jgi:hypothetical protein
LTPLVTERWGNRFWVSTFARRGESPHSTFDPRGYMAAPTYAFTEETTKTQTTEPMKTSTSKKSKSRTQSRSRGAGASVAKKASRPRSSSARATDKARRGQPLKAERMRDRSPKQENL